MYAKAQKASRRKRVVVAMIVTAIGLIIPIFIMDNRPFIYKRHGVYPIENPVPLAQYGLLDLQGQEHSLTEYSGKPTVVMFWATWCRICAHEMPRVEAFRKRVQGQYNVVGIAVPDDEAKKIAWFYQKFGGGNLPAYIPTSPVLHQLLEVRGVPKYFLLDEEGRAVARIRPKWESSEVEEVFGVLGY